MKDTFEPVRDMLLDAMAAALLHEYLNTAAKSPADHIHAIILWRKQVVRINATTSGNVKVKPKEVENLPKDLILNTALMKLHKASRGARKRDKKQFLVV